jgi:hypothetical protein
MRVTKRFVLPAICLFFCVLAWPQADAWKEYVYATDGFAITSPVAPTMQKRTREGENGPIEAHFYFVPVQGGQLIMICAPLQARGEEALETAKKAISSSKSLISLKSISFGKYPGFEQETDDGKQHQLGRMYAIEGRLYMLAASVPSGKALPAEADRWYKSFRLVSATK